MFKILKFTWQTRVIHIILFIIILFLTTGTFQINIGKITINILMAAIGGSIGVNIKKIF